MTRHFKTHLYIFVLINVSVLSTNLYIMINIINITKGYGKLWNRQECSFLPEDTWAQVRNKRPPVHYLGQFSLQSYAVASSLPNMDQSQISGFQSSGFLFEVHSQSFHSHGVVPVERQVRH